MNFKRFLLGKYLKPVSTRNTDFTYGYQHILVCDAQHLLYVCVHLFVSCENRKVHAVVNGIELYVHNITSVTGLQVSKMLKQVLQCKFRYVGG